MSYTELPPETLIKIIEGKDKTLENTRSRVKELQKENTRLKHESGEQEDGFKDTPSLNIIRFVDGRPHCSEHGAMNRYDHQIYRCIMCGVAVCLEDVEVKPREGV